MNGKNRWCVSDKCCGDKGGKSLEEWVWGGGIILDIK